MTTYAFDGFELDTQRYELRHHGDAVAVEPQVFDVLAYLVAHRDRVVDKRELLDEVWGTRFVTDSALTSRIKAARRAVGDDGHAQRLIRTVHGRGYRFVGEAAAPTVRERTDGGQAIGYCRARDGVRLAHAVVGDGPPLVKAANWLTHLRYDWTSTVWGHWLRELSSGRRLVHYDQRGCGMSDWDVADVSFEEWVADLEAVVDAAGLEQFALLGISQGGAVAATYAARHPDRVTHLVLYGAFPRGRTVRARSAAELRDADITLEMLEAGWGRDESPFGRMYASQFMPEGTPAQWAAFVELQRRTTSAVNARRIMAESAHIDVTEVATRVSTPTLVLHADDDRRVPIEEGERFAALVPGARFVPLRGHNHILLEGEPAWADFLARVRAFIG